MGLPPPAHPVAGANGVGPPIAPPQWKWRCGNRIRDMYFYSPEGKVFRSRLELAAVLSTMPNGPSADDFCWKVTEDILKTGVWTKEESSSMPRKSPAPRSSKPKNVDTEKPKKKAKQSDTSNNGSPQIPPTPTAHNGVQFSQVEPLAIRAPGPLMSKKVTSLTSRAKVKAKKEKTESSSSHTFKEILAETSSFKWLYDSETLEKFLEEAGRLNELSVPEVLELRNLLVERNLQMGNITKYPNSVLRVFVRLLGTEGLTEEPSNSLGKVELADLCVKLAKA